MAQLYSTIVLSLLGCLSISVVCTLFSFFSINYSYCKQLFIIITSINITNNSITIIINGMLTARIMFCNHWAPMARKSLGRTAQTNAQDITRSMLMKPWRLTFSALLRERQIVNNCNYYTVKLCWKVEGFLSSL